MEPTIAPSKEPTVKPTHESTEIPSIIPTAIPTDIPTTVPTVSPTKSPFTQYPTSAPTNSISITTVGGSGIEGYSGDDGNSLSATFNVSYDIAVDSMGRKYFTDTMNNCVRMIDTDNTITTIIGTGTASFSGDSGAAASATLNNPYGICVDTGFNIYIADTYNHRVRLITLSKFISTIIGSGDASFCGDFSDSMSACLNYPMGVAIDTDGNIYVADTFNHRIRRRNTDGYFFTIAGSSNVGGYSGDNGAATSSKLNYPTHVAVDSTGNLFIADSNNHRIRKVTSSTGKISTIAGTGDNGFNGDGYSITTNLNYPYSCEVDTTGTIFVSDSNNNRIRILQNSYTITIAGDGYTDYNGDQALATNASINYPTGLVIYNSNLYFLDAKNYYIRQLSMVYSPSQLPTLAPTYSAGVPTLKPSALPSAKPSIKPSRQPSTWKPSKIPTNKPTDTTYNPTIEPTFFPSEAPTLKPSTSPPTKKPVADMPTYAPSSSEPTSATPSTAPSNIPTYTPTYHPSKGPTYEPTFEPTYRPGEPTPEPTTKSPTVVPTYQHDPTSVPTGHPTGNVKESYYFSVSQQLLGINVEEWSTSSKSSSVFKETVASSSSSSSSSIFKETVASFIEGCYPSLIVIESVYDKTAAQNVHSMCVNYTVSYYESASSTYTSIKASLTSAIETGDFDTALHTYATACGNSALQSVQSAYIYVSVSVAYVTGPTIKPTVKSSSKPTSNSVAAAAASTVLLLCCFGSTGYWLFRRYKRKKVKDEAFHRWNEAYKDSTSSKKDNKEASNMPGTWTSYLTGIPNVDVSIGDCEKKEMNYNPMMSNKNATEDTTREPPLMLKKFVELREKRLSEDDTTSISESLTSTSSRRTKSVFASLKARNKLGTSPSKPINGALSSSDECSIAPSIVTSSTVRVKEEIKESSTISPIHAAAFRRGSIDPKRRTSVVSAQKQKPDSTATTPPVAIESNQAVSMNNSPESIKIRRNSSRISSPLTNIIPLNLGSDRMAKWRKAKEELFEHDL